MLRQRGAILRGRGQCLSLSLKKELRRERGFALFKTPFYLNL
jgi:hypothetical protein